ncbi:hypothetical protein [Metamycoplasma buccale]|uniref:hypothetical protein n=1 Tax=Metamycoplasma buccale TaxID=55602 RepID=UPI00398EA6EB
MTNKSKKILKIVSGIAIPTLIISAGYFSAVLYVKKHKYDHLKPKIYESSNKYLLESKITKLNDEAKKYFSLNENFIESKLFEEITKDKSEYKFIFNKIYHQCGWNGSQDKYITLFLKINSLLFNDMFKTFKYSGHPRSFWRMENNVIKHWNPFDNTFSTKFKNNILNIYHSHYPFSIYLKIDFNLKIGKFEIKNKNNTNQNIEIEFDIFVKG